MPKPDKTITIPQANVTKLTALIKETGFMSIPQEPFPVKADVDEYQKSALKVTLNGNTRQVQWPNQNATDKFVPPIITMIETELDRIISQIENK